MIMCFNSWVEVSSAAAECVEGMYFLALYCSHRRGPDGNNLVLVVRTC